MYIAEAQILLESYPQIGPMSFNEKHSAFRFHSLEFMIPVDELQYIASVLYTKSKGMEGTSWLFIVDREHAIFIEGRD